jgi:hypothetical protein
MLETNVSNFNSFGAAIGYKMSVDIYIYIYTSKEKMFSHITYLPAFQPKTKQNVFGKIITHHIPKKQTCTSTYPSL